MNFFNFFVSELGEVVYTAYPCMIIDDSIDDEGYYYPATVEILRYPGGEMSLGWYRGKVFEDDEYDVLGPTFEEYFGMG